MIAIDEPVILTSALIGGHPSANPNHPRTRDDIIREGVAAARAGASILHIHARTDGGRPTQDADVYLSIAVALRDHVPDIILNFTTGGSPGMSEDERLASLRASPELASLDAGSMNFGKDVLFVNSQSFIDRMAREMGEAAVMPEIECFDAGMVMTGVGLIERELVGRPALFQFVLGVQGGAPARVDTLASLVSLLPEGTNWAAVAVGAPHFPIMAAVLALGGHVRTGLEDVAFTSRGVYARSNAELVQRAVTMCAAVGRPVATSREARALLALRGQVGRAPH